MVRMKVRYDQARQFAATQGAAHEIFPDRARLNVANACI